MDIKLVIVFWLILFGMWLWILLKDIRLLKANEELQKKLRQALKESQQSQSQPVHCFGTEKKPQPSPSQESNHQAGHTPHSPS
jgi:cytoskeletal protein RodZ